MAGRETAPVSILMFASEACAAASPSDSVSFDFFELERFHPC